MNNQAVYIPPEQVEADYTIPRGTLANWRSKKVGPKYRKVGRRVLYRRSDVESFLDRGTVTTIDQRPAA